MTRRKIILAAYLLDFLLGDPEWLPHPVRLIGNSCAAGETALRKLGDRETHTPQQRAAYELVAGAALTAGIVAGSYLATARAIHWMRRLDPNVGNALEALLAWTCLAARSLDHEGQSVMQALERGDLDAARLRLARIVGRDTQNLDASEICRAVIETVAESASDGVIATVVLHGPWRRAAGHGVQGGEHVGLDDRPRRRPSLLLRQSGRAAR